MHTYDISYMRTPEKVDGATPVFFCVVILYSVIFHLSTLKIFEDFEEYSFWKDFKSIIILKQRKRTWVPTPQLQVWNMSSRWLYMWDSNELIHTCTHTCNHWCICTLSCTIYTHTYWDAPFPSNWGPLSAKKENPTRWPQAMAASGSVSPMSPPPPSSPSLSSKVPNPCLSGN